MSAPGTRAVTPTVTLTLRHKVLKIRLSNQTGGVSIQRKVGVSILDTLTRSAYFLDKESFYLISRYDGRALQAKADGFADLSTLDENDPTQMWVASDYGNQMINVKTNLPLQVDL